MGKTETLAATILPDNASDKTVTWSSSAADIVSVKDGEITALKSGEATITAKCGELAATCKVTVKSELPDGALPGMFSVSATKQVHFSQGNLIATIDASGAPAAWKFATNQYDCLGEGGANKTIGSAAGDVDLFGWSTAATNHGINTSTSNSDYSGDFKEWGKNIGDGSTWRTLSITEWQYLLNTASRMKNSKPCYSNAVSGVTIESETYKGVFLYPDEYNGVVVSSAMTWAEINAAGIVFLPAAGFRNGSLVYNVGNSGYYWSSSAYDSSYAFSMYINSDIVYPDFSDNRYSGYSVRLITECR